jgi:hypothetical protein
MSALSYSGSAQEAVLQTEALQGALHIRYFKPAGGQSEHLQQKTFRENVHSMQYSRRALKSVPSPHVSQRFIVRYKVYGELNCERVERNSEDLFFPVAVPLKQSLTTTAPLHQSKKNGV